MKFVGVGTVLRPRARRGHRRCRGRYVALFALNYHGYRIGTRRLSRGLLPFFAVVLFLNTSYGRLGHCIFPVGDAVVARPLLDFCHTAGVFGLQPV